MEENDTFSSAFNKHRSLINKTNGELCASIGDIIDRKLLHTITTKKDHPPLRDTVIMCIIMLKLNIKYAEDLLMRAGYAFACCSKRDNIIKNFIEKGIYDIYEINVVLMNEGCKLLIKEERKKKKNKM